MLAQYLFLEQSNASLDKEDRPRILAKHAADQQRPETGVLITGQSLLIVKDRDAGRNPGKHFDQDEHRLHCSPCL